MFEDIVTISERTVDIDDCYFPPAGQNPEDSEPVFWGIISELEVAVVAEDESCLAERDDVQVVGSVGEVVSQSGLVGPYQVHSDLSVNNPQSDIGIFDLQKSIFFVYGRLPGDETEYNYVLSKDRLIELLTQ